MRTSVKTTIRQRALDVCCALTLAVGAVYCASSWQAAALARGEVPDFYQYEFAPAVMVACGRGEQNVPANAAPALDAFLALRTGRVDCGDLPPDLPSAPLSVVQRMTLYLQWTVGTFWRATGPSWAAARTLSTVWCGILAVLFYAAFRLILPALPAWIAAGIFTLSPENLSQVWRLRDYAKAPFMLFTVIVVGLLLHPGNRSRRRQVLLASLAGAAIGLGLGFRSDLQLAAVVAIGAVAIALPGTLRDRATAIAAIVVTACLFGGPAIAALARGNTSIHATILGWAPEFNRSLGVKAAAYEPVPSYNDSGAIVAVVAWSERTGHTLGDPFIGSAEYERLTAAYLLAIWQRLPADICTRAIAAAADRLGATFVNGMEIWLPLSTHPKALPLLPAWLCRWQIGVAAAGVLALALVVLRPPLGAGAIWIGLLLLGGASVQYASRHLFYLDFVPVWCAAASVVAMRRIEAEPPALRRSAMRVAGLLAVGLCVFAAWLGLRHWQAARMGRQFDVLRTTPLEAFPATDARSSEVISGRDRTTLLAVPPDFWAPYRGRPESALLRVELSAGGCTSARPVIGVRYTAGHPDADISKRYAVDLTSTGSASLVIPVYQFKVRLLYGLTMLSFAGLELTPEDARCVAQWGRIRPPAETEPWFPTVLDARPAAYQMLDWEASDPDRTTIYVPAFQAATRDAVSGSLYRSSWIQVDSRLVTTNASGGWDVSGVPGSFSYLLQAPTVRRSGTPLAVVRGVLRTGALTIGLVGGGRWVDQITVVEPGRFTVAIPGTGATALVIASGVDGPVSRLDATIDEAGWAAGAQATAWAWPSDALSPPDRPGSDAASLKPASSDATAGAGVLRIDGTGSGKYSYVATTDAAPRRAGATVNVRGEIESGGLSVGLQSDGAWIGTLNIEEPGPFLATLRVPADATYSLTIARDAREANDRVRGRIDSISWGEGAPTPATR